ncbi:MAG: hypothetical protein AAF911_15315 [Planctomycetota bacterium]
MFSFRRELLVVAGFSPVFLVTNIDAATIFFASGASVTTEDEVTDGTTGEQVITNVFTVPEFDNSWGVLTSASYEIDCTGFVGLSVDELDAGTGSESAVFEACIAIDDPAIDVCGDEASVNNAASLPFDVQLSSNDYYPNGGGTLNIADVSSGGFIQFTATSTYSLTAGPDTTTRMTGGWFAQGGVEYVFTPTLLADIAGASSGGQIVPDGVVGPADQTVLFDNFGLGTPSKGGVAYYNDGDLNGDGMVNAADITILNDNWGNTAP